ncbi:hypothetical protein EYF80_060915 [Liparis tanakae]|uniref:Uncharacterized protein n=1 Tax=Liparis tanakae TaxID=230148 RepID=A0A4Z2EJ11_9TELE|nr:hypothetical protein EYF80_060915 [Liparis tanakae]
MAVASTINHLIHVTEVSLREDRHEASGPLSSSAGNEVLHVDRFELDRTEEPPGVGHMVVSVCPPTCQVLNSL